MNPYVFAIIATLSLISLSGSVIMMIIGGICVEQHSTRYMSEHVIISVGGSIAILVVAILLLILAIIGIVITCIGWWCK